MSFTTEPSSDVLIVGGGVIGLSIAYFLSLDGVAVTILDQGQPGQEASWAGAGMLPPGNLERAQSPVAQLRAYSHQHWRDFSQRLKDQTGIDNGYVASGGIEIGLAGETDRLRREELDWCAEGVSAEWLTGFQLQQLEPALSGEIETAYRLSQLAQVRNPRHLKALISACVSRGVRIVAGATVTGFDIVPSSTGADRILTAKTVDQCYSAAKFVIAGGAWSRGLLNGLGVQNIPIQPVRGQIVLLSTPQLPFRHVINHGPRYLVPRPDGRILIGSTQEHVGFDKTNTASGVADLLQFAQKIVPQLANAKLERTWAGLRPGSPDGCPYLGLIPNNANGYIAAGHFRNGLQLSPGTGKLMAQMILGQPTQINLETFRLPSEFVVSLAKPSAS